MNKKFDFLGVKISVTDPAHAIGQITSYPFTTSDYISFPDASVVKEASADPLLTSILNNAYMTMPDGKPSQLAARLQGIKELKTVSGFHLCKALLETELTHYFYGGTDDMLRKMKITIEAGFPEANVLGYKAPPFVGINDIAGNSQIANDIQAIDALKPDLVWIGISSPKQDYLIHHYYRSLSKSLMLGVGGVFLYFADESLKSPEFIKKMGLRWAYRLLKEPSRLWPKYYGTFKFLIGNSGYFLRSYRKRSAIR